MQAVAAKGTLRVREAGEFARSLLVVFKKRVAIVATATGKSLPFEAGRGKVSAARLAFKNGKTSKPAAQFASALFRVFNKRVFFVVHKGDGSLNFEGMVHPSDLNTIIIDADARQGFAYLIGHELGHSIQHQQPKLYDDFKAAILAMAPDWADYNDRLAKVKDYDTQDKRDAEFVNDIRKRVIAMGYTTTNADVQAILWYPEKDLWAKLRGEDESNLKSSYDEEFIKIAESRGLGAEAQRVAQAILSGRSGAARSGIASDQGADGANGQGITQGGETATTPLNSAGASPNSLRSSELPAAEPDTFAKRIPVSKPLTDEARRQQEAFGKNVSSGKLASFGNEQGRKDQEAMRGESTGLRSADLPKKLRADSPEWKAMSKDERMAYLKGQRGGLRAAELPASASSGDPVVKALAELAKDDEVFRYPISKRYGLQSIMADVFPQAKYLGDDTRADERSESKTDKRTAFSITDTSGKEKIFYVYERGAPRDLEVFIDVSRLDSGDSGAGIYAAVGNYAHNNNGVFIGDPAGLTDTAVIRRTSAMLSLALRFGTTRFMEPAAEQLAGDEKNGIAQLEWKGNHASKVRSLITSFLGTLQAKYPGIKNASYDFGTGQFLDRMGRPIRRDDSRFDKAGGTIKGRAARAGEGSLRRGIFLQSLISGESGQESALLGDILRRNGELSSSGLDGLFASPLPDSTGDTFAKRVPVSKPLTDEARRQQEAFGKNVSSGKLASFGTKGRLSPSPVAEPRLPAVSLTRRWTHSAPIME